MKAVGGCVTSSEPVSLKEAARVMARFAARDNDTSQAVSAYLKRASASFTDLLQLHRELRRSRKPGDRMRTETASGEKAAVGGEKANEAGDLGGKEVGQRRRESGKSAPETTENKAGEGNREVVRNKGGGLSRKEVKLLNGGHELGEHRKTGGERHKSLRETVQAMVVVKENGGGVKKGGDGRNRKRKKTDDGNDGGKEGSEKKLKKKEKKRRLSKEEEA